MNRVARRIIRNLLPGRLRQRLLYAWYTLRGFYYSGSNVYCSCCERSFSRFLKFNTTETECPGCHSLPRHRMLALYLEKEIDIKTKKYSLLHFAPEPCLEKKLKRLSNVEYVSADIDVSRAMVQADIANLQFENDAFDLTLCLHVLDHAYNDEKAMRELCRVLRADGLLIMMHTVHESNETLEYSQLPIKERVKAFDYPERKRKYGQDYFSKLKAAGFKVEKVNYPGKFGEEEIRRYGLAGCKELQLCKKR